MWKERAHSLIVREARIAREEDSHEFAHVGGCSVELQPPEEDEQKLHDAQDRLRAREARRLPSHCGFLTCVCV